VATATSYITPALKELLPFAKALGPAQEATKELSIKTAPIIKNEIRPFARQILPIVDELKPSTEGLGEAFPKLATSFSVVNEFFNELAYNPGPKQAGFVFFLDWANHNLNSVVSTSDAHGVLGRSVIYFNCELLKLLQAVEGTNESVKILIKLLKPPTRPECVADGLLPGAAATSTAALKATSGSSAPGTISPLISNPFSAHTATASTGKG
jgi:phospholipid/cholesterol/gamma-HCH transport system substrate-binding protein